MKEEIESATKFLVELIKNGSKYGKLSDEQLQLFRLSTIEVLTNHYSNHWFPEHPVKGSGYRCIRNNGRVDPILARAGQLMGLAAQLLHQLFPHELTMWVDPHEVSYRIGENGSICVLYETRNKFRSQPSPPVTPPNKRIRCSPEPPATPMKTLPSVCNQVTPPPSQALSYHQHFSPSNSTRSSPYLFSNHEQPTTTTSNHHHHRQQQHQLALLKEVNSTTCKSVLRANHVRPLERLFVSSWL